MPATDVRVTGLKPFMRHLKVYQPEVRKEIVREFKVVAGVAAEKAKSRMPVRSGRARASVKVGVTQRSVYLQSGGSKAPYTGWLDYGGVLRPTGGRRNTQSRPVVKTGRYLYPAVRESRGATVVGLTRAIDNAAERAGL